MPIEHTKRYGIYHWDTFDNETILIDEFDSFEDAKDKVKSKYGDRISKMGADRVDIVDLQGIVVEGFSVT